jgi:ElaB/YqjD/DUF883 family membrane-anchored ribosome-binding protein
MAREVLKEAANGVSREVSEMKSRADLSAVQQDLRQLQEDANVVLDDAKVLGRDLTKAGKEQLNIAEEQAKKALNAAQEKGMDQYAALASYVRNNPGQSIAMAFVGGIIASMLFGRRS